MNRLAEGNYVGELVGSGLDTLNNVAQTPYIYLRFKVKEQIIDGDKVALPLPQFRNVKLFVSEKSWPYTKKKLAGLGFGGDFGNLALDETVTHSAQLKCSHKESGGKHYENWDVCWGGDRDAKPPVETVISELNEKWKNADATDTDGGLSDDGPPPDDDIPF